MQADHRIYMMQVEKAPTVVKAGLKKEEAEELKKKLEAGVSFCSMYGICCRGLVNAMSAEIAGLPCPLSHADMC